MQIIPILFNVIPVPEGQFRLAVLAGGIRHDKAAGQCGRYRIAPVAPPAGAARHRRRQQRGCANALKMNHRVAGPGPGVFYLQVVNAVLRQQRHLPVVSHRARAGHGSRYVQVGVTVLAVRVQQVRRHPVGKDAVEIGRFPGVVAGVLQKSVNGGDTVGLAGKQSGQPVRRGVVFPQIMGEKRRRAVVAPDAVAQLVRPVHQGNIGAAQVGKHTVRRITRPRYRQLRQALVQPCSFRRIGVPMDGVLQFVGQHPQVAFTG